MRSPVFAFASAILRSVLSAAYWFLVLVAVYGAVAGDRNPALPPPTMLETYGPVTAIIAGGVILHALISLGWRRVREQEPV